VVLIPFARRLVLVCAAGAGLSVQMYSQDIKDNRAAYERIFEDLSGRADAARMETARRRAAAEQQREVNDRLAEFVAAWNDFIAEYGERGTFNARKAKRMRQAWSALERANLWGK
jgi:hypothetical protein